MERAVISLPIVALLLVAPATGADAPGDFAGDKRALAGAQAFVGTWRGVGQLRRGSSQGAWTEQTAWAWRFKDTRATLVAQLTGGKYFSSLELQATDQPGRLLLIGTPPDGDQPSAPECFKGGPTDGALVFTAEPSAADRPARVSLRLAAGGDRMVVLYEGRPASGSYARLAEVGSTRQGSSFATTAASGPECVVTGGLGTIAVEHQGKKYFVCCGGCREYFLEDPERALAEYRERKAAEKAPAGR